MKSIDMYSVDHILESVQILDANWKKIVPYYKSAITDFIDTSISTNLNISKHLPSDVLLSTYNNTVCNFDMTRSVIRHSVAESISQFDVNLTKKICEALENGRKVTSRNILSILSLKYDKNFSIRNGFEDLYSIADIDKTKDRGDKISEYFKPGNIDNMYSILTIGGGMQNIMNSAIHNIASANLSTMCNPNTIYGNSMYPFGRIGMW
nr:MAG TPA: hypothetical protein [Caudoviricetes sp.]